MTNTSPARPARGRVHWVGAGLSTGSGLARVVRDAAGVTVWSRTPARADACLQHTGVLGRVEVRAFDRAALAAALEPGDVVVAMIPAAEHGALTEIAVATGAHVVSSSYTSPEVAALDSAARESGSVVLTESGLDPGIDHLIAHELVARALAAVGPGPATVSFTSYCGGLPEHPGEFRYRFSWAPTGVLLALRSPARMIEDGAEQDVTRPWTATRERVIGGATFEVYPNRDSIPFLEQYRLPAAWRPERFVRGTARPLGWRRAWTPVFEVVEHGSAQDVAALADDLAARYPMTPDERDRVVLDVALEVRSSDGRRFDGEGVLDLTGTAAETAMARCVSQTVACGVSAVLGGRLPAGLSRAATDDEARRWLAELDGIGIPVEYRDSTPVDISR